MGPDAVWVLALIYACGYVTGAVLVPARADGSLAGAAVRPVAGLQLSTIGFLLSMVLSLPWWSGPVCLVAFVSTVYGRRAFQPPRLALHVTRGGVAAAILAAIMLAPVVVSSLRMAPGDFPPVFFNVDSAYFLEKVHALVRTETYPPASLSVLGGRFAYHFGTHGMAAILARASGLAPHLVLFAFVLPLLACGIAAAAVLAWRRIAPAVPAWLAIPLLLTIVPNFWYDFWTALAPALSAAVTTGSLAAWQPVAVDPAFWGIAANTGQNLGTLFLVLASLAAVAAAPSHGWRLPVFLIGAAVLFKAPTGLALAAGFGLAQICRALLGRSLRPLAPLAAAAAVFACVYAAFWVLPGLPVTYRTDVSPLFHLTRVAEQAKLGGLAGDVAWLLLPALVILAFASSGGWRESLPLAAFAIAPFIVVNLLRAVDLRPGRGADADWLQVLLPVPIVVHAFVLSVADARWTGLARGVRAAFVVAVMCAFLPSAATAAWYTNVLIATPERGHEFVDNRSIGEALRAIPVGGSVVVTNDLRYPAGGFSRNLRQLQIPALAGHQAFAVNYAYESYSYSAERLELQALLQADHWSDAIDAAARTYGWTHLLVHKHFQYPRPVPLEQVFENADYAVYRFTS